MQLSQTFFCSSTLSRQLALQRFSYLLSAICYLLFRKEFSMSNYTFNGLGMSLGNLARLSDAQTRSISAENFSGGKGEGGKTS
jgi:hypothetical protein